MKLSPFNWLALSFFGYYCAYGVFMPFLPAWLKSQAYSEETIGLIIASSYLFRFVGGLLFSSLVKKSTYLLNALRYLSWAGAVAMLVVSVVAEHFWLLCIAIWLFSMINAAGMPLGDTLATTWQQQINLDYGKVRLIGSLAFVVGVVVFGNIIGFIGDYSVVWVLTGLLFLYAVMQIGTPTTLPQDRQESVEQVNISFMQLLKNKTTLRLLIAVSLIQGSHAAYYSYSVLYWKSIGISVQTTSLLWGLSVIAEILLFFFSTKLFKFSKVSTLFYYSAIAAIIRWTILSYVESVSVIAVTQLLHCLTYALSHYAIIRYISTQPQNTMAKLQGLYSGFSACAAIALFTALAGVLYPISPATAFITMNIFAFIAIFVIPRKVDAFLIRKVE